jgi:all-trans-retinol 13,14-reductase
MNTHTHMRVCISCGVCVCVCAGVHYVGRVEKYGHLLDQVSDGEKVRWQRLGSPADGFCYDQIKIGDTPVHPFRAGEAHFLADLAAKFPEEEGGLRQYLRLVKQCNKQADIHFFGKLFPKWVEWLLERTVGAGFQALASRTVSSVLDDLFISPALKALLLGQSGDYGMPPSEASFFIHAGIVAHYLEGAFYPIGGPQVISRALIPTITRAGGRVFVNAAVSSFLIQDGVCTGVVLESGLALSAPVVVSGAGAHATQQVLVRTLLATTPTLPPILAPKHASLLGGISHMYAFLGFRGDSEELQLPSSNLWVLPSEDSADYYQDPFSAEQEDKPMLLFAGFPSAKDPSLRVKYPNKTTCVVITEAKAEWFDEFRNSETNKRPEAYEALKKRFEERLVAGVCSHFPQLQGRLEYCQVASPLTNAFYLGRAASYGLTHQVRRGVVLL